MCLAIPGKIEAITNQLDDVFRIGKVAFGDVKKDINLSMVPEAKEGDYVMVHVGVAISVVNEEEANKMDLKGTPASIINGRLYVGYLGRATLEKLLLTVPEPADRKKQ